MSNPIRCPDCRGEGTIIMSHVRYADGTGKKKYVRMDCLRCKGAKTVPAAVVEWMRLGNQCREQRVNGSSYMKLGEVADAMGLSCVDVSGMEQGKSDPARLVAFWEKLG